MTGATLPRVLLVDDEPNVLDGLRRQLRHDFAVEVAVGGQAGLNALQDSGSFSVVVSDFYMPGMNGAAFLAAAREAAPEATRMLLTGHADLEGAAAVVNRGQVFRLLLKPTSRDELTSALTDAVEHHRLVVAERELLEQTLQGSVKALADVVALANPTMFARSTRTRLLVASVLDAIRAEDRWAVDLAAILSQLGSVSLPPEVSEKLEAGADLGPAEREMVARLPGLAEQILAGIPRMEPVREVIRHCRADFAGPGGPDVVAGADLPLGARVLRLVQDYDELTAGGMAGPAAMTELVTRRNAYDPRLLAVLDRIVADADQARILSVRVGELAPGMTLTGDVRTRDGVLLVPGGQEVTVALVARVRNFATMEAGVAEPLKVRPAQAGPDSQG